jgi:membrane fusion protein (multidrug efflux system)
MKIAGLFIALTGALVLAGCAGNQAAPLNAGQAGPPPPDVLVTNVVQKDVAVRGDWVATLDGYVNANIQPQVGGYLIKQNYREGSVVHKDDVLFEIDPRPFQAVLDQAKGHLAGARGQLGQAQAQLELAKINVKRDTPLAAARAIPQSQLDNEVQAQAQAEALVKTDEAAIQAGEAAVEQAELNLGFTKVRSLIDGIAGIATTQIGNLVSPTTVLTTVSQVNPIKAYFSISEQEYLSLAGRMAGSRSDLLNQASRVPLELTLSNGQTYPHAGHMIFADRQVDSQTGTIRIVGAFDNPGNLLRPGQFGRIRATTAVHKSALLVPQRAVTELQGRYQVAVVGAGNRVSIRNVQVGDRVGGLWVVSNGVQPGERVISEGTSKVADGLVVNPKPDTSGASPQAPQDH